MSTESDYLEQAITGRSPAEPSAFELLADQRRRELLRYLDDRENPAALTDIAESIAREERRADTATIGGHAPVSSDARRRVQIALHHVHVPMLADANAVDVDPESNEITLCERGRTLLDRLHAVRGSVE